MKSFIDEISKGESQDREFKQLIDNPESIAGELVAFANSTGGVLFVGVSDDGHIVGVDDEAQVFQTLTNICRDGCIPPISPVIEEVEINDCSPGLQFERITDSNLSIFRPNRNQKPRKAAKLNKPRQYQDGN